MQTYSRAIILSGGTLGDWALSYIKSRDLIIAADRGAWFAVQHGLKPHMSLGDFDSIKSEQFANVKEASEHVNAYDPVWKYSTDTDMAFEYALSKGVSSIIVLGATGSRLDHTLANIHLLRKGEQHGIDTRIIDAHNEVRLIRKRTIIERGPYDYISLLPLSEEVTGITLSGFRYPLQDAVLTIGESTGISNEFLQNSGTIDLKTGMLLVIQSKD